MKFQFDLVGLEQLVDKLRFCFLAVDTQEIWLLFLWPTTEERGCCVTSLSDATDQNFNHNLELCGHKWLLVWFILKA